MNRKNQRLISRVLQYYLFPNFKSDAMKGGISVALLPVLIEYLTEEVLLN